MSVAHHHFICAPIISLCKSAAFRLFAPALFFSLLLTNAAVAQYSPHIRQIDTTDFPKIRVYVSVTDAKGNPIPDNLRVTLSLSEDGNPVSRQTLSPGRAVWSVLVIDVSGSMDTGGKLDKARESAIKYIDDSPSHYHIAVVSFSSRAQVIGKFSDSRDTLRNTIRNLSATGLTALQDGVGLALEGLRRKKGRKHIIALSDGKENNSSDFKGPEGYARLIERARSDECTISTIGLGNDVDENYLKKCEVTGGSYLFSPNAEQLHSVFEKTSELLKKEITLEYTTSKPDRNGLTRSISVELTVGDDTTIEISNYTNHGVIPHVRGHHMPYLILVFLLLYAPSGLSLAGYFVSVYVFRSKHIERLNEVSPSVGKRDPNMPEDGKTFQAGDTVIKCPDCNRRYYIQSWRWNRCHCMFNCEGQGGYCYQRKFPRRLREALDSLSNNSTDDERGRRFLCRCAGDSKGC